MNLPNKTLSADEEYAIKYFRRKHNNNNVGNAGNQMTAQEFLAFSIDQMLADLVTKTADERAKDELLNAFRTASLANQATVRTTLGISDP